MSIVRYNSAVNDYVPTTFSNLIDRFFNEAVTRRGGSVYGSFVPKVDVIENEKDYEIQVAIPGIEKENIKIDLNDNYLTISGERRLSNEKDEKNFHSVETQYGTFSRSFSLPENADANKINAKYENGILEIKIVKDEKKILKASIKVN